MERNQCSAGKPCKLNIQKWSVHYRVLAEPDTRGKKGKEVCSRGRGGGEKRACIFHAKSSSRSVRVQHVLSSPIAPVGVVPWKPLVCAFLQPSVQCHTRKKRRREREEASVGKSRCSNESLVLSRARGWSSLLYCAYIRTVYVRYRYKVWKNCISSMEKLGFDG